eukprot:gb/GECG01002065.1/.p1 GENE.gb/GECG01002065.1/~~gb/GECG01002065.1/.p1  ORF type:complete len:204 (+),score=18.87 gb/GECG01002065.1/:1-612(+)
MGVGDEETMQPDPDLIGSASTSHDAHPPAADSSENSAQHATEEVVLVLKDAAKQQRTPKASDRSGLTLDSILQRIKDQGLQAQELTCEDGLHYYIISAQDGDLFFRYACRTGMCRFTSTGALATVSSKTLKDFPHCLDSRAFFTPAERIRILFDELDYVVSTTYSLHWNATCSHSDMHFNSRYRISKKMRPRMQMAKKSHRNP